MNEINRINNWLYLGTKNLDFHYPPDLAIIGEIDEFTKVRQQAFNEICKYLKRRWDRKNIDFYLYNDDKQTTEIWDKEVNLSFALPDKLMIHMGYLGNAEHETTHLISHYMTKNSTKLKILDEGLAVSMSEKNIYSRININKIPNLEFLFNNFYFLSKKNICINYKISGIFVTYLLKKYNLNKFKEAWNETAHEDNEKNKLEFERVYHKSIEELEKEFISWLNI